MPRDEQVEYGKDHLGNEVPSFEETLSLDGMEVDDGLVQVQGGDTGTDLVAIEIPDDVQGLHVVAIHAYNGSGGDGTFHLKTSDLDNNGDPTNTTRRSIPIPVVDGSARFVGFDGKQFDDEAVVINSEFSGWIGLAYRPYRPESLEPNTTDYSTPSN